MTTSWGVSLSPQTFTMLASLVVLLSCSLVISVAGNDDLLVRVKNGKIQGKAMPVLNGEVRFFLGVPYAKPPLGNLRFKPTQPAEDWEGVRDATRYPNTCYQLPDKTFPSKRPVDTKGQGRWLGEQQGAKTRTIIRLPFCQVSIPGHIVFQWLGYK